MRCALSLLLPLLCCGCYWLRSAAVPMPFVEHPAPTGNAHTLMVLLPGIGGGPEDFERNGFVDRIHAADGHVDVIAADAHFAYYPSETLVERLHEDIVAPRADGYREVWLVGISLGGLGSAIYAQQHGPLVDRLLLLAPYSGTDEIYEPIAAAGGLQRWAPPATDGMTDELRQYVDTWSWYRERTASPSSGPQLYLGYGLDDGFRVANGLLAAALDEERCFTQPGAHTWSVWTPLFERMLARAFADAR